MGIKTRNMSGLYVPLPLPTGTAAAAVCGPMAAYPFTKKGMISHLALVAGVKPTGGAGVSVSIDIVKNPSNVTSSAITGGTSIFGATKPSWTWGTAGALAGDLIEWGTTGAGNEKGTDKVPAGWSRGDNLNSGALNDVSPGDFWAYKVTLNDAVVTGSIMTALFAFDVYPGH